MWNIFSRRSKYCLRFSVAWARLKLSKWPFHPCTNFGAFCNKSVLFRSFSKQRSTARIAKVHLCTQPIACPLQCLRFSVAWARLKISKWPFHPCTNFGAFCNKSVLFWSLIFHPSVPQAGLYLGYLRDRCAPPPKKNTHLSPKILLSLHYISNCIRKIIQTRRGQCTYCNISQNCVWKCTRLIASQRIFISKHFRGSMPPDPPWKLSGLISSGHSGILSQTINSR